MTRRVKSLVIVMIVLVLCAIPLGFLALLAELAGVNNEGSPALAAEWRAVLLGYKSPDEAASRNPNVVVLRLNDDEWVFGLSQDSHGVWHRGGGTLVVRDSRGEVRYFKGHVCGPRFMDGAFSGATNLNSFYEALKEKGFSETR